MQIRQAVAATVAAIPTFTPYPAPTSDPTLTPGSLAGLFCEYQFCIGHPVYANFFDKNAIDNPRTPSTYERGMIYAYNENPLFYIITLWLRAPGVSDPQFLLDTILEDHTDTRTGNMDVKLIRDMNVLYTSITTTATDLLPFGGAAAWTCGERVFAWKAYTPQGGQAATFFEEALIKFRC